MTWEENGGMDPEELRLTLVHAEPTEEYAEILGPLGYEICPNCWALNAYAWQDSNMQPNYPHKRTYLCGIDGVLYNKFPDIYHIPAASCFDWTCGKCGDSFMPIDSPIAAEVYTHVDYSQMGDEE